MPAPVFTDVSMIRIPGRTDSMLAQAASRLKSQASARSIFVMAAMSAVLNSPGYLSGLSSPSVTDSRARRTDSPRSQLVGQTRLPTFSMKR
jgi:hypothetical protein